MEVWDPLSKMPGVFWTRWFSVNQNIMLKIYHNMFKNYTNRGISRETITVLSAK
jgi:hypothetical protein